MIFHVLTLFPEMVRQGLNNSIIGRAMANDRIEINAVNIRDFSRDKHNRVDDYTYGGGAGMLMQAQPVYDAWLSVAEADRDRNGDEVSGTEPAGAEAAAAGRPPRTIYVTPQGAPFTQKLAAELSRERELIFLCGHYEGVDERVLEEIVTDRISLGDYVLTGGELPAMVMIDAIARLVPGVLHNEESAQTESFHNDLLEYPQYSRPEEWHGKRVPEALLSGDHGRIRAWRLEQSRRRTEQIRPDLYERYLEKEALVRKLSGNKRHNLHMMEALRRGRAEILYHEGENVLLYDAAGHTYMISGSDEAAAAQMTAMIAEDADWIVASQEFTARVLHARFGDMEVTECRQACYTQRNPLPVRHRDIRRLSPEHLNYVASRYTCESEAYLSERIRAGALYGVFAEGELAGFMGWHSEGSLGMLYVDKRFRRMGLGRSLEAFCINLQLGQGYVPYGHIKADNESSLRMQERMGLYLSAESLWWLEKRR